MNAVMTQPPSPVVPVEGRPRPTKSLLVRTGTMTLAAVLTTLGLFIALILPTQQRMLIEGLESMAQVMATSIDQITVTSIVVEDYSPVIEHCMKVVQERDLVRYIAITRKDGFSLIHMAEGWRYDRADTQLRSVPVAGGEFVHSDLVNEAVYHYSYPLQYSGIDWGWIQIGLSRERFDDDQRDTYTRTAVLGGLCVLAASLLSFYSARRLSRPIRHLNQVSRQVAAGTLSARATVTTGDDIERLAESFNQMTETLHRARTELENRVAERTQELSDANTELRTEIRERQYAEDARRQAETELEAQRTAALRSDRLRSLGEMAAGIAHELNQPLMGVRVLAEHIVIGLERGWDLDCDEIDSRMRGVLEQTDRMVHIIQHVRMFAREAGQPTTSAIDVSEVVDNASELLGAQFRAHGLELIVEHAEGLPPVLANPYSLEEAVLNLLSNARDAIQETGAGGGRVRIHTRHIADRGNSAVRLEVADNGAGIAARDLPRVFDPFFSTKDPSEGTGLGLAVSRTIVEDLGGSLTISSEPGQGTIAAIELPASGVPSESA